MRTKAREDAGIFLRGLLMGSADVVPGVSGGTVALITGIYERLINALGSFDARLVGLLRGRRFADAAAHVDLRFLAALGLGVGTAILSLAKLITWAMLHRPVPTWSLFLGLILGSLIHVLGLVRRWSAAPVAAAAAGAVFAWWLCGLLPMETAPTLPSLFFSAMVAICAMILPGISGSFILVVLGKYLFVLEAVHRRDLGVIAVFGAGCAAGLLLFTKLLKRLLRRWHDPTMACLCGLLLGSLRKVWPFKADAPGQEWLSPRHRVQINVLPDALDAQALWALGMVLAGAVLVLIVERLARRK